MEEREDVCNFCAGSFCWAAVLRDAEAMVPICPGDRTSSLSQL